MDFPTRVRGVEGKPPTGTTTDGDKIPFWQFSVQYPITEHSGRCKEEVSLVFLLGDTKKSYGYYENVTSIEPCLLPDDRISEIGISCGCGYLDRSLVS